MQSSERGRVRSFSLQSRFEVRDLVEDGQRQKRDRRPSDGDPGSRRISFPADVFGPGTDDDQRDGDDSQARETAQSRSENRTSFGRRERFEKRRGDEGPESDAAPDPEGQAQLIQ